jgi:hypothetical protein
MYIDGRSTLYERQVYNILDLLSDLGGVLEIMLILFAFAFAPISEYGYYLKLAKNLFFARVKEPKFLKQKKDHADTEGLLV